MTEDRSGAGNGIAPCDVPTPGPDDDREGGSERRTGGERARAARYLDIWEGHVSFLAVHGKGIMAPWFMR